MLVRSMPDAVSHKATEFNVGKAMSRTPSCSGTTKFINPITNGIAMKKIMMVRRQVSLRAAGSHGLLGAHHDGVREAAQQHDQRQNDIHDTDALMVDGRDPLAPKVRHVSLERDPPKNEHDGDDHARGGGHHDRLVERDRVPAELAEEIHFSALCDAG
jgi:hypothetical protein